MVGVEGARRQDRMVMGMMPGHHVGPGCGEKGRVELFFGCVVFGCGHGHVGALCHMMMIVHH